MNELSVFKFGIAEWRVRVLMVDGEPWWVAKDVCDVLGFRNGPGAVRDHVLPRQTHTERIAMDGGVIPERDMLVINEAGLYRLIMRSKVAGAEHFQDWVTGEVLPTIRKTGGAYIQPGSQAEMDLTNPDTALDKLIEIAQVAKAERAKRVEAEAQNSALQAKVAIDAPKAAAWDELAEAGGAYCMGTVAKILGNIGQNRLFKLLRQNDVLIDGGDMHNTPYQRYAHHFKVIAKTRKIDGKSRSSYKTLVPPADLPFVARKVGISLPEPSTINEILATEGEFINA